MSSRCRTSQQCLDTLPSDSSRNRLRHGFDESALAFLEIECGSAEEILLESSLRRSRSVIPVVCCQCYLLVISVK
jgi:hypothetical protein